jgi:hypothetical protein
MVERHNPKVPHPGPQQQIAVATSDDFRELKPHRQAVCRIRDLHAGTRPYDFLNWLPTLECLHDVCRSDAGNMASEEVLAHGGQQFCIQRATVDIVRQD